MSKTRTAADTILAVDKEATHTAAQVRDTRLAKIAGTAADVADQPPLIALSIGTALIGVVARRPDLIRGGLRMLASHLVATGIKNAIKHRVDRTRPNRAIEAGEHRFEPGSSQEHDLSSFPSGHLAGAVAVGRAAAHEIHGTGTPALLVTTAVAAAQAPAGKHYLSDMAAGAVIGWVSEAIVGAVFDAAEPIVHRVAAGR